MIEGLSKRASHRAGECVKPRNWQGNALPEGHYDS